MKVLINLLMMLLTYVQVNSQSLLGTGSYTIGDKIPSFSIENILNYKSVKASLSDFRGKLILLDFMTTGCVPCIKVLPFLDSLQKQYGNKVQIILVSPEKRERVESFLKKNKYLSLPFVAEDSNLSKLFPHLYISHVAWINPNGIVSAITHTEYITAKNIETILDGNTVNWPVKRDVSTYDVNQPLLQLNKSNIPEFSLPAKFYYTAIVDYMPGIQKYAQGIFDYPAFDSVKHFYRTVLINYSIIDLYLILNQQPVYFPKSQILLDVKDRDKLVYNPDKGYYEDWLQKNFYCVEAFFPNNVSLNLQKEKLLDDLDFYLGLHGRVEKKFIDCWVLRNSSVPSLNKKKPVINGLRVGSVVSILNNKFGTTPVIDESAVTTGLTLPLTEVQVSDSVYLRNILDEFGFKLVKEKRELNLLVIKQQ